MKVLFLTVNKESPSARWRVLQLLPALKAAGVTCDLQEWPGGMISRMSAASKAGEYDVVFLQKRLLPRIVWNRLRNNARALVYEYDDSVTLRRTSEGAVSESPTKARRFRRSVQEADAVISTNDALAEQAQRLVSAPDRVHVIPTVIDLSKWTPRDPGGEPGKAAIGWMGTSANLPSLDVLRAPLAKVCRRHEDVTIRVVCDRPPDLDGVNLEHKKYAVAEEVEDIRSFDIAVAPLVEDPFTRGKLSTKVLSYMAAGVPPVASDVNANRIYVRDGEEGYLVGTLGKWRERLDELIENPARRAELGRNARARVEREFSVTAVAGRYVELFRGLSGGKSA